MLTRIAAIIVAMAFVLSASPKSARAQAAAAAPITVQDCHPDNHFLTFDMTFTNVAPQPVTKVRFALVDASGALTMVDDAGNFPAGDVVRHRDRLRDLVFLRLYSDIKCLPATVTFQDGTTWQNPSVGADMEASLPQTPGSQIAFSSCVTGEGVDMSWKNTAQQNATEVDMGLVQHGVLDFEDDDKGTFSPGTLIERQYGYGDNNAKGDYIEDDMLRSRCIVLGVKYADGTAWTNPSAPPFSKKGILFAVPTDPDPNAPVTITGCDGKSGSDWHVDYQNASTKPIVAADFALIMHGKIDAAGRDWHNLAPGSGSTAHFGLDDDNVYHPACIPLRVNYADGTVWYNPLFAPAQSATVGA